MTREFDLDFYISKIFHRQHCVQNKSGMFIKNLSLIGADLDSSILIDVRAFLYNYDYNILLIRIQIAIASFSHSIH